MTIFSWLAWWIISINDNDVRNYPKIQKIQFRDKTCFSRWQWIQKTMHHSRFQVFSSRDRDTTTILLLSKLKQDWIEFQVHIQINSMQADAEIKGYKGVFLWSNWPPGSPGSTGPAILPRFWSQISECWRRQPWNCPKAKWQFLPSLMSHIPSSRDPKTPKNTP